MSNHLAFATVNYVLQQRLDAIVGADVSSATATNTRPDGTGVSSLPSPGVNIYLLQAVYNGPMSDPYLPTMSADARRVARPVGAFDLTYMLTFHGDDSKWEPQRVQASVLRHIHTNPIIGSDTIRTLINALPAAHVLKKSNLADQLDNVKLTPSKASLEDLSKIWSVFFQKPYVLTSLYQASIILLESDISPEVSLPIREVHGNVVAISELILESLDPESIPATTGTAVVINGSNLLGKDYTYWIGGIEANLDAANSTADAVKVKLAAGSTIGPASVLVKKPSPFGAGHDGASSNSLGLKLHANVTAITYTAAVGPTPAHFDVSVSPKVQVPQIVSLVLNRTTPPTAGKPWSYLLPASPRNSATNSLTFTSLGVESGTYLYRLRVDGVDTPLSVNTMVIPNTYDGPTVAVP